jgi:hypothetical protein
MWVKPKFLKVAAVITQRLYAAQDRDTSVRDTSTKGRIIQGTERPRTLVWGYLGRGHILITSNYCKVAFRKNICLNKKKKAIRKCDCEMYTEGVPVHIFVYLCDRKIISRTRNLLTSAW